MPGTRGRTHGAHGAGLALVEALEAVPHAELVARGRQVWRMPHTMLRECGRSGSKMRTTWGQEQEAAALLEVLHMFPGTPSRPRPCIASVLQGYTWMHVSLTLLLSWLFHALPGDSASGGPPHVCRRM